MNWYGHHCMTALNVKMVQCVRILDTPHDETKYAEQHTRTGSNQQQPTHMHYSNLITKNFESE